MAQKRIGIYAGTFDPVHAGHVAFALQAKQAAELDKVYFLPERRPRSKTGVEHFGHRVAMLHRALQPHPAFDVLELTDMSFTVAHSLPQLKQRFPKARLVFLMGSDVADTIIDWPDAPRLLRNSELLVGLRNHDQQADIQNAIEQWPVQPQRLTIVTSYAPEVSSGHVRDALYRRCSTQGLLSSVERYSNQHWLYVSLT